MESRATTTAARSARHGAAFALPMMPSTLPVELREASQRDFAAITAIYAHHVRTGTASFEIEPPDVNEMMRRWREVMALHLPYVVAVAEGEVIGYAYAGSYRPRPAYRFTVEDSVYVAEHARGRGIGRALLMRLIDDAERAGARQMIAVIGDVANEASIRVHAALGFRQVGVLKSVGNKFSRWLDVVLMQRVLGAGDSAPVA